jgi:hypothetical protein
MTAQTTNNRQAAGTARLIEALRRDPKRSATLGILLLVLIVALIYTFGSGQTSPRAASAMPNVAGDPAGHSPSGSARAISAVRSSSAMALRQWLAQTLPPAGRNLFQLHIDYFPLDSGRAAALQAASAGGFWDLLDKSIALRADQKVKRESLISAFLKEAETIRPTSTIMGPNPKAMIDGKLVVEGDVVASFRIVRIEERRILVEREGIRLEVPMK